MTGKLSNKPKSMGRTEVDPALTPRKLEALNGAYLLRLKEKGKGDAAICRKMARVHSTLSDKIRNLKMYVVSCATKEWAARLQTSYRGNLKASGPEVP